jgi:hypothetical protein
MAFHNEDYPSEVLFHFIPMVACNLLLGRPWQYDKGKKHVSFYTHGCLQSFVGKTMAI